MFALFLFASLRYSPHQEAAQCDFLPMQHESEALCKHRSIDEKIEKDFFTVDYLKAGMMEGGVVSQRIEGTPQGSPLSPLLSNILLDELDKELNKRGHKFVRYADDCSIYVKSRRAAERVLGSITCFIEAQLLLRVNREKTKISRPHQSYLLGFSFYQWKGKYEIRIGEKSLRAIIRKCKEITKSSDPTK